MYIDLDKYTWKILPGRKVCHAIRRYNIDHLLFGMCGRTNSYKYSVLLDPSKNTRKCEQCLMSIIAREIGSNRIYWRAFLESNPEYGPPSWRDHSIGIAGR